MWPCSALFSIHNFRREGGRVQIGLVFWNPSFANAGPSIDNEGKCCYCLQSNLQASYPQHQLDSVRSWFDISQCNRNNKTLSVVLYPVLYLYTRYISSGWTSMFDYFRIRKDFYLYRLHHDQSLFRCSTQLVADINRISHKLLQISEKLFQIYFYFKWLFGVEISYFNSFAIKFLSTYLLKYFNSYQI